MTLKSDEIQSAVKWEKMFSFIYLHLDAISLSLGVIFLLIGLFNIVPFPQYKEYGSYSNIPFHEAIYSLCFAVSAILFTAFIALHFELFSYSSLKKKLSAVMICLSFPLMTTAFLFSMYREVVAEIPEWVAFQVGHAFELKLVTRLVYGYPYAQVSHILATIGIVSLLFGIILKMRT